MLTISIINYKGGVGKTTLTANIAAELAFNKKRVLVIDLDPQTNLTFSFLKPDDWEQNFQDKTIKTWYDAFIDNDRDLNLKDLIIRPKRVNNRLKELGKEGSIDLISSHLALIDVDLELAAKLWGGTERTNRRNFLRVHSRLKAGLKELENSYDFVLIDCPPNINVVTKTAIVASDFILSPAKPDYLSTIGIDQLQNHVTKLVDDYNTKIDDPNEFYPISPIFTGVIFTMVGIRNNAPYKALQHYISQVQRLGIPTFETIIRENKTLHSEAPQDGVPVVLSDAPTETHQNVRSELENLVSEIISRTGI